MASNTMMNFKDTLKLLPMLHRTRLVPLLLGHTGIGKTELAEQYAAINKYELIIIHVAQLEPSDFVGLYKTTVDGRTMTCPPNWLPYVKDLKKDLNECGLTVDSVEVKPVITGVSKGYVILLDEINRGHEDIRQAMYQFLTTKKLHTYSAPPNTHLIATANPASKYETYEFDDALTNRFANIKFCPDVDECLDYLFTKHGKNMISTWLGTDKGLLEMGEDNFEVTGLKLTPRMAENAILLYRELENEPVKFQRMALETIMPKEKAASFMSFLDEVKNINYVDVINGVNGEKIKQLIKGNRIDILSTVVSDLATLFRDYEINVTHIKDVVKGVKVSDKEALVNVGRFMSDSPSELVTMFLNSLQDTYEKKSCVLNDKDFVKPLQDKLREYKEVLAAAKASKDAESKK